jgi:hypothetical protein
MRSIKDENFHTLFIISKTLAKNILDIIDLFSNLTFQSHHNLLNKKRKEGRKEDIKKNISKIY